MRLRRFLLPLLLAMPAALPVSASDFPAAVPGREEAPRVVTEAVDTVVTVERVQVTAIKQGLVLRHQPVAASVVGRERIERQGIRSLKDAASLVPNFHMPDYGSRMTSSLYVRGLGARIDQPVVGLNVDNVPYMNKDAYDFDLADIERIEVLRGPQSTLYGRNTMGGVINIYTLSPLTYEGARIGMEYGSGNTWRVRASSYFRIAPDVGVSVAAHYGSSDGFYTNDFTGHKCDWERSGGGRFRVQWAVRDGLRIDNTLAFGDLRQGGYAYAFAGRTTDEPLPGEYAPTPGRIAYNDPCSYRRTTLSDGFTVRADLGGCSLSSITSYQYLDDEMVLDQDFLPLSYFTLTQARTEHALTEDVVVRSRDDGVYRWLAGAFGFVRHMRMEAPVTFLKDGIDNLILSHIRSEEIRAWWGTPDSPTDEFLLDSRFRNPSWGAALYHESTLVLGRWRLAAGLRVDYEHGRLDYRSATASDYTTQTVSDGLIYPHRIAIDNDDALRLSFTEVLPRFSAQVRLGAERRSTLYASVAKGYKAGGFNTQMFSDVLQQQMMKQMGIGTLGDVADIVTYKPEKSWNYELGSHLENPSGTLRADLALFWIDCRDQQLTVFPDDLGTGRMMTNAGRTRSFGGEASLQAVVARRLELNAAYGYTNARFVRYDNGQEDFRHRFVPYAPQHTASVQASWAIPAGLRWLDRVVVSAGVSGLGRIWWNERNSLGQPFYLLTECSVRFEHRHYTLDLWVRNLFDTRYDAFYFVSIRNAFVQQGRPRTMGVRLSILL
ncbi:MAG: TonB-dependent receptor [Alistipes sp.]|jgi:outer membrane receptor proteins, mostly Fe transport|uniref:TonB-dependent receptor n=1 Tax=Alistipes sp. TaxID=1872444 RepID=UPI001DE97BC2|nr:TonB-dependent receptor [Alistipes sp.]MBS6099754.1 TonB-dependent receptor [Alistipes sp.]HJI19371.1 TonB-dependent receptor [Rikenellaceae bacterium]